jgi:acyl-coenzyme A synthetase/AMP-(fatty) acid ligase/thioesterase domain-containing protein
VQQPLAVLRSLAGLALDIPSAVAISAGERALTYEELFVWAGGVAVAVNERDPVGSAPVPVLVDRSLSAVAGLFGVLLAGRAVCPVDITEPAARTARTLARLGTTVAVDGTAGLVALPDLGLATVQVATVSHQAVAPPAVAPHALASVIFTSGSTGVPKGVVHDAMGSDASFEHCVGRAARRNRAKLSATAPLGFAAGFGKVVFDLAAGSEIVMVDPSAFTPEQLADWIDANELSVFHLTPSLARTFAQRLTPGRRLQGVTEVATFGEGLAWSDVAPIRSVVSERAMIRPLYGASEGGGAFEFTIEPDMPLGTGSVPLGRLRAEGLARLEAVSDEPGSPTQLVVVGRVAVGYWGDPELTAQRFGTDPDGRRFWRSGDLAHIGDDGLFRHGGRLDDLVKIRGKLVEPAEPERVLRDMASVRHAVVLPHTLPAGATRLVAHIEPATGDALDTAKLRGALRATLPAHLVPSVFMRHERLPLNHRGKVDRTSLGAMPVVPWRTAPARPAVDEVELVVTGVVSSVLGIGAIGPDDDLWDFGCDSLAAVEIVTCLADAGFEGVALADLLDATTPAAIAARVRRPAASTSAPLSRLNAGGTRTPLWLLAGAGGSALAFRALAAQLGPEQPAMALEAHGIHRRARVDLSIRSAARRHLRNIHREQPAGPYLLAGHSAGGLIAFEVARSLSEQGEQVAVVLIDVPAGAAHRALAPGTRPTNQVPLAAPTRAFAARARTWAGDRLGVVATVCGWRSRDVGARYGHMFQLGIRVARRYQPTSVPSPVEVMVVQQRGSLLADGWRPFAPHLQVHEVDGDHNSMLQPPHVAGVAAAFEQLFAARSADG